MQAVTYLIKLFLMNTENRVSPQAPEVEEAIIGACLIEQDALPADSGEVTPGDVLRNTSPVDFQRFARHAPDGHED